MAEDAREVTETAREVTTAPGKKTQYTPTATSPNTANEYAARPQSATVTDAVKSIALEDFRTVHMQPCVRNSLLFGIGTGFAFGGLRLVLGGTLPYSTLLPFACQFEQLANTPPAPIPRACNWAAGTFAGASLVTYEVCQYRRYREKAGMQRAVEIIDRRKVEREQQMKEKRERQQREAEERAAEEEAARLKAMRPWYKFW